MPTVRLGFSPTPSHVRTARLVAVAVARRAGVAEDLLDEIRLAVGEACARAVALHRRRGLREMVRVTMTENGRFTVEVVDQAPDPDPGATLDPLSLVAGGSAADDAPGGEPFSEEALAVGVGLALLSGLVEDLAVTPDPNGPGTLVRMTWPLP